MDTFMDGLVRISPFVVAMATLGLAYLTYRHVRLTQNMPSFSGTLPINVQVHH